MYFLVIKDLIHELLLTLIVMNCLLWAWQLLFCLFRVWLISQGLQDLSLWKFRRLTVITTQRYCVTHNYNYWQGYVRSGRILIVHMYIYMNIWNIEHYIYTHWFFQTLHRLFIVNAGSGFRMLWKAIKAFMDARTLAKIHVIKQFLLVYITVNL